jgi:hypothetical protein
MELAGKPVFITSEYAMTRYQQPEYNFQKKVDTPINLNNTDTYTFIPGKHETGEGFVVLLDYGKPPYQIFPIGYIHINSGFASKNLGLPGLDINSLLNLGGLPLQLNSLDAFIAVGNINKITEDNYQASFIFADFKENNPIQIDFPLVADGLPDQASILESVLSWLNTRKNPLHGTLESGEVKYFLSDNANVFFGAQEVNVAATESFTDSQPAGSEGINIIRDDIGNPIQQQAGDGVVDELDRKNANSIGLRFKIITHRMGLNWDFAKRAATYEFRMDRNQFINKTSSPAQLADGSVIEALGDSVRWSLSHQLRYRLSNSTDMRFRYSHHFDRYPNEKDIRGGTGNGNSSDDGDSFEAWVNTSF